MNRSLMRWRYRAWNGLPDVQACMGCGRVPFRLWLWALYSPDGPEFVLPMPPDGALCGGCERRRRRSMPYRAHMHTEPN